MGQGPSGTELLWAPLQSSVVGQYSRSTVFSCTGCHVGRDSPERHPASNRVSVVACSFELKPQIVRAMTTPDATLLCRLVAHSLVTWLLPRPKISRNR